MPSHHEKNAKGVSAAAVDGPNEGSSVGKLSVSYASPDVLDGPNEDQNYTKAPDYTSKDETVDGPNTPDPMASNGPTSPSY